MQTMAKTERKGWNIKDTVSVSFEEELDFDNAEHWTDAQKQVIQQFIKLTPNQSEKNYLNSLLNSQNKTSSSLLTEYSRNDALTIEHIQRTVANHTVRSGLPLFSHDWNFDYTTTNTYAYERENPIAMAGLWGLFAGLMAIVQYLGASEYWSDLGGPLVGSIMAIICVFFVLVSKISDFKKIQFSPPKKGQYLSCAGNTTCAVGSATLQLYFLTGGMNKIFQSISGMPLPIWLQFLVSSPATVCYIFYYYHAMTGDSKSIYRSSWRSAQNIGSNLLLAFCYLLAGIMAYARGTFTAKLLAKFLVSTNGLQLILQILFNFIFILLQTPNIRRYGNKTYLGLNEIFIALTEYFSGNRKKKDITHDFSIFLTLFLGIPAFMSYYEYGDKAILTDFPNAEHSDNYAMIIGAICVFSALFELVLKAEHNLFGDIFQPMVRNFLDGLEWMRACLRRERQSLDIEQV